MSTKSLRGDGMTFGVIILCRKFHSLGFLTFPAYVLIFVSFISQLLDAARVCESMECCPSCR
jgi:hypothetical protein